MWKNSYINLLLILFTLSGCTTGPLAQTAEPLVASGAIHTIEIELSGELGGRIKALHVQAGDEVVAGELLVELDASTWQLQLGPAQAAVAVAEANLEVVLAGARAAEIDAAQSTLALAEAQRDKAFAAWENAQGVAENPQELNVQIHTAEGQVALAAQQIEMADAAMRNAQYKFDRQKASPWELQTAQAAFAAAQAEEQAAQTLLNHLRGIRAQPRGYLAQAHAAEGEYHVAEAGVAIARAKLVALQAGPTNEELAVARAMLQQARAQVNELEVQLHKCQLTSPIDGVVLRQALQAGELAAPVVPILTLANLDKVRLEVYVPENRIGHVQLGQQVAVTVDSFPQRTFSGEVIHLGNEAEFTPRNVATAEGRLNTFYAVEIQLQNPEHHLKPGMPADAQF
ncbi:MAG TPA: HlyD family efflux transporter periplasmic adaptor subunit [Thermoflexia bacterium]|nr:HlyD family efflux transporter periplasmic adaptor subunit [Thermoflexia bacterium]